MVAPPRRFAARWSLAVWFITVLVIGAAILLLVAVATWTVGHRLPEGHAGRALAVLAAFVPVTIVCVTLLFAPLAYTLAPGAVIVNRMGPDVVIAVADVARLQRVGRRDIGFAIRVFGSGGFFGGFGRFYSRRLGHFRAYTTNTKDLILITLADGGKVVISPHPPDVFLELLRQALQNA